MKGDVKYVDEISVTCKRYFYNDEDVAHRIASILQMEETLLKQKIAYLQDVTDPGTTSEYEQGRQQLSDKLDTLRRSVKMDLVSRDDVTLRTRARFEQSLRATSATVEEACLIQDYLRIEATMLTNRESRFPIFMLLYLTRMNQLENKRSYRLRKRSA